MGIDDGFVAKGETEEEVIDKMMEHIKSEHPEKLESMSKKELVEMMKKEIKEE